MSIESNSMVEFLGAERHSRCGYCRSANNSFSHGMWAHQINPWDYEGLIERGWRRSGQYIYKPVMSTTCCPLYPIRCDANNLALSKSQKKILRRINAYLANGRASKPEAVADDVSFKGGGDSARDIFQIPAALPSHLGVSLISSQSSGDSEYDSFHTAKGSLQPTPQKVPSEKEPALKYRRENPEATSTPFKRQTYPLSSGESTGSTCCSQPLPFRISDSGSSGSNDLIPSSSQPQSHVPCSVSEAGPSGVTVRKTASPGQRSLIKCSVTESFYEEGIRPQSYVPCSMSEAGPSGYHAPRTSAESPVFLPSSIMQSWSSRTDSSSSSSSKPTSFIPWSGSEPGSCGGDMSSTSDNAPGPFKICSHQKPSVLGDGDFEEKKLPQEVNATYVTDKGPKAPVHGNVKDVRRSLFSDLSKEEDYTSSVTTEGVMEIEFGSSSDDMSLFDVKEEVNTLDEDSDSSISNCGIRQKKAKDIRREKKISKLLSRGFTEEEAKEKTYHTKTVSECKTLEDYVNVMFSDPAHKLEVRLVQTNPVSSDYMASSDESFALFKKYQIAVHGDKPKECNKSQYRKFLVHSPLEPVESPGGSGIVYGSFHQQYWLDDELIAVGVIDILPNLVSAVYFFYDPDLKFLNLGTYGSLREIEFSRQLSIEMGRPIYYCMGYYVHSCQKMRYKSQYTPSYILCPETYIWQPLEKCLPKLDVNKYSRLEENSQTEDEASIVDFDQILVCFENQAMSYSVYRMLNHDEESDEEIVLYCKLVGAHIASRMLLLRQ